MNYISTRGSAPKLSFEEVLLTGLASDGGLYVPETLPQFSASAIDRLRGLSYEDLAIEVMFPFVSESIDRETFKQLVDKAYNNFNHAARAPLVQLDASTWVLELFHGPTLAFKDFALQLLGQLLNHFLVKRGEQGVVMGATSGDTGSAAIEACVSCERLDIFILHPHQRVSDVQRRQMTSVIADNVGNIALEGNFDDCQQMVKASFADQSFLPQGSRLIAVNSINWARIMAQIVYYFHAVISLGGSEDKPISFSVPTGNFGDIYAGYLAKRMGLPIGQLIVATNANNILHRAINENDYSKKTLEKTWSPSMDIMVSSNFERLLFDAHQRNGAKMAKVMSDFEQSGEMRLENQAFDYVVAQFASASVDDDQTIEAIQEAWAASQYLADPHTAIGMHAAGLCRTNDQETVVCLATAHPAKFEDAITNSRVSASLSLPPHLSDLLEREESFTVLENSLAGVQSWIQEQLKK